MPVKKQKEKVKRKRGKKFDFKKANEKANVVKTNPFEQVSKTKFAKFNKQVFL